MMMMALNPNYGLGTPQYVNPKSFRICSSSSSSSSSSSAGGGTDGEITEEEDPQVYTVGSFSSARTQLNLLDQLKSSVDGTDGYESRSDKGVTIRDQLADLVGDLQLRSSEFTIPLGKNLKKVTPKFLTVSQKRNIRRQDYLNKVSRRNDSTFFATIGAFVILPPILILGFAVATGYVQLLP